MPRNVRNFWIELEVDGRETKVACGPARKDGGFYMTVKMRDGGEITKALFIEGKADDDGNLTLIADSNSVADRAIIVKTIR